ncbi:MAG: leucine-rich repeat domain-containing protein [Prevotella sp.]|nr:leucine-rich repeat domain-containing protein [Prevotella sp.]
MKTRVLTIIIALLSMAVGAQAANYTALIYDGKKLTTNDSWALIALTKQYENKITTTTSGSVTTVKNTSGTTLFSYNTSTSICTVTGLTPWNNDMSVTFSATTKNMLSVIGSPMTSYDGVNLKFEVGVSSNNFPDAKFRSWVYSQIGVSVDHLSASQVNGTTSINVEGKTIANLKGIEFFTSLKRLYCSSNQLSALNLSGNAALTSLDCDRNQLTSLDVSKNTALTYLNCEVNQLTSLDVSKNRALKELYCWNNKLTALNVSNNTALINLRCYNNQLTSLDVSKNTALKDLFCNDNRLTAVNVSNNAGLTQLDCSGNQLTVLNVSKNADLTKLGFDNNRLTAIDVSKNTKLTYLNCSSNLLTALDVSNNKKLTSLDCSGNQIRGAAMTAFVNSLPSDPSGDGAVYVYRADGTEGNRLTTVQVKIATDKGWIVLVRGGENWERYPGVDPGIAINASNFPDAAFRSYVSTQCDTDKDTYLSSEEVTAVKSINVSGKNISKLNGIEHFTALAYLYCSNNQLTALDVSKNTALRLIECYKNKLRGTAVDNLISSLPRKSGADLNFYNNETSTGNLMTYDQVQAAKQKGWTPRMMSTVDGSSAWAEYAGSDVVAIDATNFPDANFRKWLLEQSYGKDGYLTLAEIATATFIDVSWKDIASLKGIEYFTALTELRCYENQLTSLNVSGCTALTVLRCFGNELMSLDVSGCTALTCLYCDNNELNSLDVSKNTALTDLDCTNNLLTSLDASKNTKLQTLQCSNNRLTSLILSKNATSLASINCDLNSLRGSSVDDFISSLPTTVLGIIAFCGNEAATGNRITIPQAKTARRKGWEVCQWNNALNNWVPYSGDILAGDANGDDEVNDEDLEAITDYLLGRTPSTFYSEGADMNGNGEVDIVDLTKLIKKLTE